MTAAAKLKISNFKYSITAAWSRALHPPPV